jgi:regulator of sirC expression with transglutaminase-like and TPR domain
MLINNMTQLAQNDPELIHVEEVALILAKDRYPDLDMEYYLKQIDDFARRARMRVEGVVGGPAIAAALSAYLFEEEGFRANQNDYYNPSNSYLNDVIDQRAGIPISLGILYIAIARRLDLPVHGVNFPGHFLIRYSDSKDTFYIDPFLKGRLLTEEACRRRFVATFGDELTYRPEFLTPILNVDVLLRMLSNLKMAHVFQQDLQQILHTIDLLLTFTGGHPEQIKERGLLYYQMECFRPALDDLENYLEQVPLAQDRFQIKECVDDLRNKCNHIH